MKRPFGDSPRAFFIVTFFILTGGICRPVRAMENGQRLNVALSFVHIAASDLFEGSYFPAVSSCLKAIELEPGLLSAYAELWRSYSALGRKNGYDQELVLREIYHLEKLLDEDPYYLQETPEATSELEFLISMENRVEEVHKRSPGARIIPEGLSQKEVSALGPLRLPEDHISLQEKFKSLDRAISRLQNKSKDH